MLHLFQLKNKILQYHQPYYSVYQKRITIAILEIIGNRFFTSMATLSHVLSFNLKLFLTATVQAGVATCRICKLCTSFWQYWMKLLATQVRNYLNLSFTACALIYFDKFIFCKKTIESFRAIYRLSLAFFASTTGLSYLGYNNNATLEKLKFLACEIECYVRDRTVLVTFNRKWMASHESWVNINFSNMLLISANNISSKVVKF